MSFLEIIIISFALAMDAFSVSVSCGIYNREHYIKVAIKCGLFFGIFQGLMALGGLITASTFSSYIEPIDHWVAFVLLAFVGGRMIYEAFAETPRADLTSLKSMLVLSVATSIDAFAAGIGLAAVSAPVVLSVVCIAVVSLVLSYLGVLLGTHLTKKSPSKLFDILGGVILLIIGTKILIDHLG